MSWPIQPLMEIHEYCTVKLSEAHRKIPDPEETVQNAIELEEYYERIMNIMRTTAQKEIEFKNFCMSNLEVRSECMYTHEMLCPFQRN